MPPEAPAIAVEGLVREFRGVARPAVDGISLSVGRGEIYGFLGPNGAGKSTTVHILTTLLRPTAGRAQVAGWDVVGDGPRVRRAVGAALQGIALDGAMSACEHLELQGALHGLPRAERRARSTELVERAGLAEAAHRRVRTYSGGMKRRLELALALVHRPAVLFLDEPTTGLDPASRSALWNEVARLAREDGTCVFLTTHYLEEADALAGRIGIIDRGRIVAEGTPAALKAQIGRPTLQAEPADPDGRAAVAGVLARFGPEVPTAVGTVAVRLAADGHDLASVVRALDSEGLGLKRLQLNAPTLDDVFLAKTGRLLEGT
jgi:ABC-2 type transport system ATP-binding protein